MNDVLLSLYNNHFFLKKVKRFLGKYRIPIFFHPSIAEMNEKELKKAQIR